jgi:hypothetical protein
MVGVAIRWTLAHGFSSGRDDEGGEGDDSTGEQRCCGDVCEKLSDEIRSQCRISIRGARELSGPKDEADEAKRKDSSHNAANKP